MNARFEKYLLPVATFVLIAAIWELAARLSLYNSLILPPPSDAFNAITRLISSGTLNSDLIDSASRYVPGYIVGTVLGVVVGAITGTFGRLRLLLNPLFNYLRSIPPVTLIPLSLLLFGIGDLSKVAIVAWSCFFPLWLNTHIGTQQVPTEYLRAAKIFRMNTIRQIFEVRIPASLPLIVSGLRMAIATGIFALVAAEMFTASSGIGFRIIYSHQLFNTDEMVGMILLLGLIALILDKLMATAARATAKWENET